MSAAADGGGPGLRTVRRTCPQCGADGGGAAPMDYAPREWAMTRCAGCGFVYLANAPDYTELVSNLAWEKTREVEFDRKAELRPISHRLSLATRVRMKLMPRNNVCELIARYVPPGRVIDLGCGGGTQFDILDEAFIPFGIDISEDEAASAEARFAPRGGHAINAPCREGLRSFPAGYFTGASLRSYLEHESDPKGVLAALHHALAPGGAAVIKVPNYGSVNRVVMGRRWCGFRFPDHLNYFTPSSLTAMVRDTGFRLRRFGLLDHLPTSDNMWMIIERPGSPG